MSGCNDQDRGLNVTRHESVPTSSGSLVAREFVEPKYKEKQMTAKLGLTGASLAWNFIELYRLESHRAPRQQAANAYCKGYQRRKIW
jgi:hypothetical protein